MKKTLLIVDDEPLLLKMLALNLADCADVIVTAVNGVEALERIRAHDVGCILCDINMPKMNGVEVIKVLRGSGNATPFIFYTAHGNHDLMLEAARYGAFDFLNKPDLSGVEETVKRAFDSLARGAIGQDPMDDQLTEYQRLLAQISGKG